MAVPVTPSSSTSLSNNARYKSVRVIKIYIFIIIIYIYIFSIVSETDQFEFFSTKVYHNLVWI